jgi:hypothetical protein
VTPFPSFAKHPVGPPNQNADLGEGECDVFMKRETKKSVGEQRHIVANLDGLQAKVKACGSGGRDASSRDPVRGRGGVVTSSVRWTSSPKGEDSALRVF